MPGVPWWESESGLRDCMGFDFYLALLTEHIIIVYWLLSLCKKDGDNGRMDEQLLGTIFKGLDADLHTIHIRLEEFPCMVSLRLLTYICQTRWYETPSDHACRAMKSSLYWSLISTEPISVIPFTELQLVLTRCSFPTRLEPPMKLYTQPFYFPKRPKLLGSVKYIFLTRTVECSADQTIEEP